MKFPICLKIAHHGFHLLLSCDILHAWALPFFCFLMAECSSASDGSAYPCYPPSMLPEILEEKLAGGSELFKVFFPSLSFRCLITDKVIVGIENKWHCLWARKCLKASFIHPLSSSASPWVAIHYWSTTVTVNNQEVAQQPWQEHSVTEYHIESDNALSYSDCDSSAALFS